MTTPAAVANFSERCKRSLKKKSDSNWKHFQCIRLVPIQSQCFWEPCLLKYTSTGFLKLKKEEQAWMCFLISSPR